MYMYMYAHVPVIRPGGRWRWTLVAASAACRPNARAVVLAMRRQSRHQNSVTPFVKTPHLCNPSWNFCRVADPPEPPWLPTLPKTHITADMALNCHIIEIHGRLAQVTSMVGSHLQSLGAKVTVLLDGEDDAEDVKPATRAALLTGKQVITDAACLRPLICDADVVIVSDPASARRLGFDADACQAHNPTLIHLAMPPFAEEELSNSASCESAILAASGVFRDMGLNRQLNGCTASYSPLPLASAYASVVGALAVATALLARQNNVASAIGARIEVPLASALLEMLIHNSLEFGPDANVYASRRKRVLASRHAKQQEQDAAADCTAEPLEELDYFDVLELTDPFYTHYTCADARPFYLVAPSHRQHQQRALAVLGLEKEVSALGVPEAMNYASPGADSPPRHGLGAAQVGDAHAPALRRMMRRAFLTRGAFEWEALMGAAGVPGTAHRTTPEWLVSSHAREAGLVVSEPDGSVRPGPIVWLEGAEIAEEIAEDIVHAAADVADVADAADAADAAATAGAANTKCAYAENANAEAASPTNEEAAVQAEAEAGPNANAEPSCPADSRGWLDGLWVVDLANVIAGPTIGSMLARFGARVTKVDSTSPTYSPDTTIIYGLAANLGKQSVLIDAKAAEGKAALERLIASADVVVVNATEASAARLGVSPDDVLDMLARFGGAPRDAVLTRFDAYGGPSGQGERSAHLGYDDNLQAALGIMERFGGGLGRVEEHAHVGTIDVVAGAAGALATVAALLLREKRRKQARQPTPATIVARASLASVGQLVQFPFCCGQPGELAKEAVAAYERLGRGPACKGEHALLRCYEAADGEWLLLCPRTSALHNHEVLSRLARAHPLLVEPCARAQITRISTAGQTDRSAHDSLDDRDHDRVHNLDLQLTEALTTAFCTPTRNGGLAADEWVTCLRASAIDAVKLTSLSELRSACTRDEADLDVTTGAPTFQFVRCSAHPLGTALTSFGQCAVRVHGGCGLTLPLSPAPCYGEHTAQVLGEVGLDATALIAKGLAATSWSEHYLPTSTTSQRTSQTTKASPLSPLRACPVCLGKMISPIGLACSHSICAACAAKCSEAGHTRCPICRYPHLLDPEVLAERASNWRAAYSGWRKGACSGAAGEVASIVAPSTKPTDRTDGYSAIAGDLACSPLVARRLAHDSADKLSCSSSSSSEDVE